MLNITVPASVCEVLADVVFAGLVFSFILRIVVLFVHEL